jgi:uncharacterized protein (TIGR03000 family)
MPPIGAGQARLTLELPAHARLTVNDEPTPVTGTTLSFMAPGLLSGQAYPYTFRCVFVSNGETRTITRRVVVHAGSSVRIDLKDDVPAMAAAR